MEKIKKLINNKFYIYLFILYIVIIVIFFIINKLFHFTFNKLFHKRIKSEDIPDVEWPFINLKDGNGKNINMLCVRGYIVYNGEIAEKLLEYINKGIKFIGCSSHLSFPRYSDNPHDGCSKKDNIKIFGKDIEEYVLGWCHCFREPDKYIKHNIPRILISESDFNSEKLEVKNVDKKYDYICVQPKDNDECTIRWNGYNKNWPLAEKSIKILSDDLNLKGLVIGRGDCPVNIKQKHNVEITDLLTHDKFIDKIRESKFMLLPNLEEASPRVLTESLCVNTPIFVYENILGGWKYVNDKTGVFFNENNIKTQAEKILKNINENKYTPREYYMNNYGLKNSGKQLRDFLKKIYPELSPCKYVRLDN